METSSTESRSIRVGFSGPMSGPKIEEPMVSNAGVGEEKEAKEKKVTEEEEAKEKERGDR